MDFAEEIKESITEAAKELIEVSGIKEGDILVVGCSSSEICGERIGTTSSAEVGEAVFDALREVTEPKGIYLAAQCCEHINRALVVEEECAKVYGLERVNAVPVLKAGGSFATAAFGKMKNPWLVEGLKAKAAAGMDIGDTLIGMHLRKVVVPVRTKITSIGKANLVCARTRPGYVGGERAVYNEELN